MWRHNPEKYEVFGLTAVTYVTRQSKRPMSALGQKRTFRGVRSMSALPPKADITPRNYEAHALAELPARQPRAAGERCELGRGDVAAHRRHTAIGAWNDPLHRNIFGCRRNHAGNLCWRLDGVVGNVDRADQHILAVEELEHAH